MLLMSHTRIFYPIYRNFILWNFISYVTIISIRAARNGGRLLPTKGGDDMVTYEAVSTFATVGLLIVSIIALVRQTKRK